MGARIFLPPPHGPKGRGEGGERGVGPFRSTFRAFNCVTPNRIRPGRSGRQTFVLQYRVFGLIGAFRPGGFPAPEGGFRKFSLALERRATSGGRLQLAHHAILHGWPGA